TEWLSWNMVFSQCRLGEPLYCLLMPADVSHHVQSQPLHRCSSGVSCSLLHQRGKPLFHSLQHRLFETEHLFLPQSLHSTHLLREVTVVDSISSIIGSTFTDWRAHNAHSQIRSQVKFS